MEDGGWKGALTPSLSLVGGEGARPGRRSRGEGGEAGKGGGDSISPARNWNRGWFN
jgi:hypothetical protein